MKPSTLADLSAPHTKASTGTSETMETPSTKGLPSSSKNEPGARWIPHELYNQFLSAMPISCVDVAIASQGRVLLVERLNAPARGQMWLPGGRVYKGEGLRDAALRKAAEEVGVSCHVGPLIHAAETIFEDGPRGIAVHSINTCFLLYPNASSVAVRLDNHHGRFAWVATVDDGLHPYIKACLRAAGLQGGTDAGFAVSNQSDPLASR